MASAGKNWPKDYFAWCEVQSHFWFGGGFVLLIALLVTLLLPAINVGKEKAIVVYTSQDQQFAEPIFNDFSKQTGIKVRAVYDSEAVKTVGLANRLLAERKHPRCDVWWSNEALRTWQLAQHGVLDTNSIVQFGFRSRRIVINTNKVSFQAAPKSLAELTNAEWRGKVALAYPMFGTTSAQFVVLRQHWGVDKWEEWCRALAANKPFLVDGNSVVVRLVGRGEALIGLTDSDDVRAGEREGFPVAALPTNTETVIIPNSVTLIRGAPHAQLAKALCDYLSSGPVRQQLVRLSALEGTVPEKPHWDADWSALSSDLEPTSEVLRRIFLR